MQGFALFAIFAIYFSFSYILFFFNSVRQIIDIYDILTVKSGTSANSASLWKYRGLNGLLFSQFCFPNLWFFSILSGQLFPVTLL